MSNVLSIWDVSDIPENLLSGVDLLNAIGDNFMRVSAQTGEVYFDLDRLLPEARALADSILANLPADLQQQVRSGSEGDADVSLATAAASMGLLTQVPRIETLVGTAQTPEQLWNHLVARSGVPAPGLPEFLTKMRAGIENALHAPPASQEGQAEQTTYWQRVTACFDKETLGWLILWAFAAVICIVAIIITGGTFAVVASAVAWCLLTAGVMLGLSYVYQLVVCLIQSLSVPHYSG